MARRSACLAVTGLLVVLPALLLPAAPVPPPEDKRPAREAEAAREELRLLRNRAADPTSDPDELWKMWQRFRVRHPGTPECVQAAELMSKVPSPLDKLDRKQIPEEDRLPWLPPEVVAVLGEHRGRHWTGVSQFAVSPDGKLIASCTADVRLWDAATLYEQGVLRSGLPGRTKSIAFAPKGRLLATGEDDRVLLWDLSGETPRQTRTLATYLSGGGFLVFSADGDRLAVHAEGGKLRLKGLWSESGFELWDVKAEPPRRLHYFRAERRGAIRVFLSPDGTWAADDGGGLQEIRLWRLRPEIAETPVVLRGTYGPVAFAPDGKLIATGMWRDRFVRLWDLSGDKPKLGEDLFPPSGRPGDLAFSPDGTLLASVANDRVLRLWPLADERRQELRLRAGETHVAFPLPAHPTSVTFLPDGKTLVLGGQDGIMRLWDLEGSKLRFEPQGHSASLWAVAFSPDGRTLASAGDDSTIRLWDLTGSKPRMQFVLEVQKGALCHVAFSPQGRYLVSYGEPTEGDKNTIRLWDLADKTPRVVQALRPHTFLTNSMSFSPDGRLFAIGGADAVPLVERRSDDDPASIARLRLYDFNGGRLTERSALCPRLTEHEARDILQAASAQAFSPDGRNLIIGTRDLYRWWDVTARTPTETSVLERKDVFPGGMSIQFAPSGTMVAVPTSWSDETDNKTYFAIRLLAVRNAALEEQRRLDLGQAQPEGMLFNPTGRLLLTVDEKRRLICWAAATGKKAWERALPGWARVAWAPDGRHFATANGNGTVYVFRLPATLGLPDK